MQLNKFKEFIQIIDDQDDRCRNIYRSGLDLTNFVDSYHAMLSILGKEIFTDDGWDFIESWLYELRGVEDDVMWDSEGTPIPMKTVEDVYNYLIESKFIKDDGKI